MGPSRTPRSKRRESFIQHRFVQALIAYEQLKDSSDNGRPASVVSAKAGKDQEGADSQMSGSVDLILRKLKTGKATLVLPHPSSLSKLPYIPTSLLMAHVLQHDSSLKHFTSLLGINGTIKFANSQNPSSIVLKQTVFGKKATVEQTYKILMYNRVNLLDGSCSVFCVETPLVNINRWMELNAENFSLYSGADRFTLLNLIIQDNQSLLSQMRTFNNFRDSLSSTKQRKLEHFVKK